MYTCRPMSSRPWTASEFDKVGRGKFKNSQGPRLVPPRVVACALSFALTRHDSVLVPENGMEDP